MASQRRGPGFSPPQRSPGEVAKALAALAAETEEPPARPRKRRSNLGAPTPERAEPELSAATSASAPSALPESAAPDSPPSPVATSPPPAPDSPPSPVATSPPPAPDSPLSRSGPPLSTLAPRPLAGGRARTPGGAAAPPAPRAEDAPVPGWLSLSERPRPQQRLAGRILGVIPGQVVGRSWSRTLLIVPVAIVALVIVLLSPGGGQSGGTHRAASAGRSQAVPTRRLATTGPFRASRLHPLPALQVAGHRRGGTPRRGRPRGRATRSHPRRPGRRRAGRR